MALRNEEQPFVVTFTFNSEPNDSLSQFVFSWQLDRKKLSSENLQLFKNIVTVQVYINLALSCEKPRPKMTTFKSFTVLFLY